MSAASTKVGGRLAALLRSGEFAVTGEIVPPRSANGDEVTRHARAQVGYVDAANITDNPTASAHMSPVAGASFVARAGIEPTLQLTVRDRNRLAVTADLLGAWAVGARNVLCLSGDPIHLGDHPDADGRAGHRRAAGGAARQGTPRDTGPRWADPRSPILHGS